MLIILKNKKLKRNIRNLQEKVFIDYVIFYIITFSDLQISIDKSTKINCGWYQKSTDTGTTLSFRSCALLQYKRNVIEGTVHRVFRSTSTWEEYDKATKINR